MKKLFFAAAIALCSTAALSSCTKENVKPASSISANTVSEKADVAKADIPPGI